MWRLPRISTCLAALMAVMAAGALTALSPSAQARGGNTFEFIDVPSADDMAAADEDALAQEEMDDQNGKDVDALLNCREAKFGEPAKRCVRVRFLRNFRVIDDRHVLLYESPRRVYLMTFANRCHELEWSFRMRAFSRTGELCGGAGERIIVGSGGLRERCFVRSVERVESEEHGECLVRERMAAEEQRRRERRNDRGNE